MEAISSANDSDEMEAVEWKSELELDKKHGCFHVARAILGMANRNPARTAKCFGGYGYVVVGAEAGSVGGLPAVDSAEFGKLIDSYVGGELGPPWTPVSIDVSGVHVMVFVVEPPAAGDPVWPLRREFDGNPAGRIFIRKSGATQPALASDIDMLSSRASEANPESALPDIALRVHGNTPVAWYDGGALGGDIASWVDGLRSTMIDHAERFERARNGEPDSDEVGLSSLTAKQLGIDATTLGGIEIFRRSMQRQQADIAAALSATSASLSGALSTPDERSLDEYRASVDRWFEESCKAATDCFSGYFVEFADVAMQIAVENRSDRFLSGVQVKVRFPWDLAHASHEQPSCWSLPKPPREFGEPKPSIVLPTIGFSGMPSFDHPLDESIGRRTWIEDGSINLTFDVGTLRPRDTDISDPFWMLLPARPESGAIVGSWQVTAEGIHAVLGGDLEVAVHDTAVSAADVLNHETNLPDPDEGL